MSKWKDEIERRLTSIDGGDALEGANKREGMCALRALEDGIKDLDARLDALEAKGEPERPAHTITRVDSYVNIQGPDGNATVTLQQARDIALYAELYE